MTKTINQFMWGYQTHFCFSVRYLANQVLERIGVEEEVQALLIGVLRPGHRSRHAVCVEPEDGECPQSLFAGLLNEIEAAIPLDDRQKMFYGDEATMRDKPENIRRAVTREKITERLKPFDADNRVKSYCGSVYPIGDYYVCPVIQVQESLIERYPPVEFPFVDQWRPTRLSFLESCLWCVLQEAHAALYAPEPGRGISDTMRTPHEVVARGASKFMSGISAIIGHYGGADLLQALNRVAALKYESAEASGTIVFVGAEQADPSPEYLLKLAQPVRLTNERWIRKLLQLASGSSALLSNATAVSGIVANPVALAVKGVKVFTVQFPADRQWSVSHGSLQLLRVEAGQARLPTDVLSYDDFKDQVERQFAGNPDLDANALWGIFQSTLRLSRGHMVVIAADAQEEANRLSAQGTQIEPVPAKLKVLEQACRIDGTVLVDTKGYCYAIGVILDGVAQPNCTPSRGARYNSAVRYVASCPAPRMAIVISEDATLDIVPLLRPRVEAALIENALATLETADLDNYHLPRRFLDEHRFYLNPAQCARANAAWARIEEIPSEGCEIRLGLDEFFPDPAMNQTYLR